MTKPVVRSGGHAARMRDVAIHANVSPMTVSRALREPDKVSEQTRLKIEQVIRDIGYVPNRIAGSLASNTSSVVGLIVPSLNNSLFAETIQAIAGRLGQEGFQLMIAESGQSMVREEELISAFLSQRVCGLVLHNTSHTDHARKLLQQSAVPTVETGDLTATPINCTVSYSNFSAARTMTNHLIARGRERIAFVSLDLETNDRACERLRGFQSALAEHNQEALPSLMLGVQPGMAAGAEAVKTLINKDPGIDAIFFAGDVMVVGAVLECRRQGWAVPGRIAIAGFDNLEILQHISPSITSLRLPRREIGQLAAEIILDGLGALEVKIVTKDLGFDVIQREST